MSVIFAAPTKVYKANRNSAQARLEGAGYTLSEPAGFAKTRTGGLATWFPGHPYPRKTFVYEGITAPVNKAKRVTLALFLPFANLRYGITAFLNSYLLNFNRLIDSIFADIDQIPYLHYEYYSELGKNIWDFSYLFLKYLGIKDEIAYRTGLQVATIIEMDDAYLHPLIDLANEVSKESLLDNPRKEVLRILEIYQEREVLKGESDSHIGGKFVKFAKLLSLLLLFPPIKTAFRFAIKNLDFENFKKDEWDEYWMLCRENYNSGGKPFKERMDKMVAMMIDFAKKANPDKEVYTEEGENGKILIKLR